MRPSNLRLAGLEIREVLSTVTRDRATRLAAGKKFLEMKKAGKPAPTGDQEFQAYWIFIMDYAEGEKDAATFEEGFEALKQRYSQQMSPQFKNATEERLKKLKEGK